MDYRQFEEFSYRMNTDETSSSSERITLNQTYGIGSIDGYVSDETFCINQAGNKACVTRFPFLEVFKVENEIVPGLLGLSRAARDGAGLFVPALASSGRISKPKFKIVVQNNGVL